MTIGMFFREAAGDENWRAWRVDLRTGDVRPLTPGPGVRCYIQQISSHLPSELLIAHNARDKRYFDVYRVNAATGDSTLLQRNEGFTGYFTDQQFQVRFTRRDTEDSDIEYVLAHQRRRRPAPLLDAGATMTAISAMPSCRAASTLGLSAGHRL
jgi:hypothetical protein